MIYIADEGDINKIFGQFHGVLVAHDRFDVRFIMLAAYFFYAVDEVFRNVHRIDSTALSQFIRKEQRKETRPRA